MKLLAEKELLGEGGVGKVLLAGPPHGYPDWVAIKDVVRAGTDAWEG
jgi:hypothetical protein